MTPTPLTTANGHQLYAEHQADYPNRPTLVFLHDSLGCVQLWRHWPAKLARATQCNVLVYDRLGYGKSAPMPTYVRPTNYMELEADVLHELLAMLHIEEAILFGHSDGGTIALIAASKYPARMKSVIVEAAHIFVDEVTLQGVSAAKASYATTNLPQRLQKYHGNKVDMLFKAWVETWLRADYRSWNIEHLLPAITCPLLFIQGEADEYGTLAQLERTVSQVSGPVSQYLIPEVGHTPHKEAPELVFERAVAFLGEQGMN